MSMPDRWEYPVRVGKQFDGFLSPHGLPDLSAYHRDHPYQLDVEGFSATVNYEPAESTIDMFGGNSNWRGPICSPPPATWSAAFPRRPSHDTIYRVPIPRSLLALTASVHRAGVT